MFGNESQFRKHYLWAYSVPNAVLSVLRVQERLYGQERLEKVSQRPWDVKITILGLEDSKDHVPQRFPNWLELSV